ncbi:hypothetical protein AOLI_G00252000 [Acnodon oligacanthus]
MRGTRCSRCQCTRATRQGFDLALRGASVRLEQCNRRVSVRVPLVPVVTERRCKDWQVKAREAGVLPVKTASESESESESESLRRKERLGSRRHLAAGVRAGALSAVLKRKSAALKAPLEGASDPLTPAPNLDSSCKRWSLRDTKRRNTQLYKPSSGNSLDSV